MVFNTLDYHARLADLCIEEANIAQASSISVRDLKAELKSLGVSTENVLEKGELIARYASLPRDPAERPRRPKTTASTLLRTSDPSAARMATGRSGSPW